MKQLNQQQTTIKQRQRSLNEWVEYLKRVNMLAQTYDRSYSVNDNNDDETQQKQQIKYNTFQAINKEKMTKSKHFLQLISCQRQLNNNKLTKHKLINQIMGNLKECSRIQSKMQDLLRQVSLTMNKWQKMRRQQIVRFKLGQIQHGMNEKSQINQQTIDYMQQFNNQFHEQEEDDNGQQVRIQYFNITNQYHHNHHNNNNRLQQFERENQHFINSNYQNNRNHYDNHDSEIEI